MPAPRLSIIIPALGKLDRLENSLLSVLENRPPMCEVLVVVNDQYDDPYCLEGEVRFVAARYKADIIDCINVGIAASRGTVVHLLGCGATVREGWAEPALAHFEQPDVAAVVPLLLAHRAPDTVWAAGLAYHLGGKRELCLHGEPLPSIDQAACLALGPTLSGAFYRRAALCELDQMLCPALGEAADVDLALRLQQAGWLAVFEPSCVIEAEPPDAPASTWRQACHAERLFWRHFGIEGTARELLAHAGVVLSEFARKLPHPAALAALVGRLVGFWTRSKYRVARVGGQSGDQSSGVPDPRGCEGTARQPCQPNAQRRVDAAHGPAGPHDKTWPSSRPRSTLTRSGLRYCRDE